MSQFIEKFESGGTPKKRTIKRVNDNIDLDDYIRVLNNNFEDWLSSLNVNTKKVEKQAIRKAYNEMLQGYNKGTITPGVGNESIDSSANILVSDDPYDPYRYAQDFMNKVLLDMDIVSDEQQSNKLKWDPNTGISQALSRRLFNGRDSYDDSFLLLDNDYNAETGKRGIANRWNRVNSELDTILDDYDMTDEQKSAALKSIQELRNAYSNDSAFTPNEDLYLRNLGLDNKWFYTGEKYVPVEEKTESQKLDDELAKREEEFLNEEKRQKISAYDFRKQLQSMTTDPSKIRDFSRVKDYRSKLDFRLDDENIDDRTRTNRQTAYDAHTKMKNNRASVFADYAVSDDLYNGNPRTDLFTSHQGRYKTNTGQQINYLTDDAQSLSTSDKILATQKAYALDWIDNMSDQEKSERRIKSSKIPRLKGWYVIDKQADNSGYVTVVSPDGNYVSRVAVNDINSTDAYDNYLDTYIQFHLGNNTIPSNKEGGILKMQFGNSTLAIQNDIWDSYNKERKDAEARYQKEKEDKLKSDASAKGMSVEQYKKSQRNTTQEGFSTQDYVRIGAMAADVGSMVAAWVPGYGTIGSAVLGVGSTLANAGADIADGASAWDIAKGVGIGLVLDTIGLVPGFGSGAKSGKILKNIIRYAPKLMVAFNAMGTVPEAAKSLQKAIDGKDLTVEDWKNMAHGLQAVAGINRMGASSLKARAIKNEAKVKSGEQKYSVKLKGQKEELSLNEKEFSALKSAKNPEEANSIIAQVASAPKNAKILTTKSKLPWKKDELIDKNALSSSKEYDTLNFGQVSPRFGSLDNRFSDVSIVRRSMMANPNLPRSWNPYVRGGNKSVAPQSTAQSPSPQITPSPVIAQLRSRVKPGKGPNPMSIIGFRTPAQAKSKGYGRDFAIGFGPNAKERQLGIEFDKKGGKFAKGGSIPKFDIGGTVDWYWKNQMVDGVGNNIAPEVGSGEGYYQLGGWNTTRDQSSAGNYIRNNGHYRAGNLSEAYNRNQAYTSDQNLVSSDLQSYYNSLGGNMSAEDFVKAYNESASKIRGFFGNALTYNTKNDNVRAHNQLFRQMFGNRSQYNNNNLSYNIGYQDNLDDVLGSSTWLRRMDTYENEFDPNNIDWSRVHQVGNFKVYKKANGDIGILPTSQEQPNPQQLEGQSEGQQTDVQQPSSPKTAIPGGGYVNPEKEQNSGISKYLPYALNLDRLLGTLSTNSSIYNGMRRTLRPDILDTYNLYHPIVGAYGALTAARNRISDMMHKASIPSTSDASLNEAVKLDANKQARAEIEQARLQDDQEIKRTGYENLKRVEDNTARWSDLANKNRLPINANRRELGQLDADYKLKRWNAIAGWLQEQQAKQDQTLNDYRKQAINTYDMITQMKRNAIIQPLQDQIRKEMASGKYTSIREAPSYKQYIREVNDFDSDILNKRSTYLQDLMGWSWQLPSYTKPFTIKK